MAEIRALAETDLDAVDRLLRERLPTWEQDREFLRATALEHPWADEALPSLVAEDAGEIVGFVAVQARRLHTTAGVVQGVCCSHLVVSADAGAAGALLVGQLLRGPQAATWSDSASDPVARVWRTFGGHVDHSRACDWMLVLHAASWLGGTASAAVRGRGVSRAVLPVPAIPLHLLGARFGKHEAPPEEPHVHGGDLATADIAQVVGDVMKRSGAYVDYDTAHLAHVVELIAATRGPVTLRVVRRRDRAIGWYAYVTERGPAARVLHLAAAEKDVEAVLGELIAHCSAADVAAVTGRLEPHLADALQRRFASIGLARRPVLHARDPELRALLGTSASLLTRLDSEWFVT